MPRWPATRSASAKINAKPVTKPAAKPRAQRTSKSKLLQIGDCYIDPRSIQAIEGVGPSVSRLITEKYAVLTQVPATMAAEAVRTGKPCEPVPGEVDTDTDLEEGPGANPLQ